MYTIDVADQVLKFKKNLRSLKIIIAENQTVNIITISKFAKKNLAGCIIHSSRGNTNIDHLRNLRNLSKQCE